MDRSQVRDEFVQIIKPYIKVQHPENITDKSRFIEDLNANSARLVDIVLETEDHFQITIGDLEADSMQTVGDAVDLITSKRS